MRSNASFQPITLRMTADTDSRVLFDLRSNVSRSSCVFFRDLMKKNRVTPEPQL